MAPQEGFEPPASASVARRSGSTELLGRNLGTSDRTRTCALSLRKRALCPLSYGGMEAPAGIEPAQTVLQTAVDPFGFGAW